MDGDARFKGRGRSNLKKTRTVPNLCRYLIEEVGHSKDRLYGKVATTIEKSINNAFEYCILYSERFSKYCNEHKANSIENTRKNGINKWIGRFSC